MVDLLVSVTQLIGRFAADSRVVIRVCRTALLDGDIGVRGPLGGLRVLERVGIESREVHLLGRRRVVRRIVAVVGPGDLDAIGSAGRNRPLQGEEKPLHPRVSGNGSLLGA